MTVFFRNIHLYLSLAAGIVIAIVCFTGAVLVFEKEWNMSIYPERYYVQPGSEKVSLKKLAEELKKKEPLAKVNSLKIYSEPDRNIEINFAKKEKGAAQKPSERGGGIIAYANPYTGEITAFSSQKSPFFLTMFQLHRWLLAGETGKMIVGVSTVFFLFIIATGLVLWWPKTKAIVKQRLKLKLDGGWKRINHDLHIVLGFYTSIFLFAFAFTGLAWSFEWFNNAIYAITGTQNIRQEPPKSVFKNDATPISFDVVFAKVLKKYPDAEYYVINAPKGEKATIAVTFLPADAAHERATNQVFIDQYSGEIAGRLFFKDRNFGQRVRSTFYPVHVGSIGGLPGRIIAFISCILGATFPITGIVMWLVRLKKERKKKLHKAIIFKKPALENA
ncbi:MAG TPA: PepSY-associated TM helix domain-containing protein [Patescibacteria group bacterium]|nr:PepSY-associated TM helix domain-containing protein [Patescibacteria group bacterium]